MRVEVTTPGYRHIVLDERYPDAPEYEISIDKIVRERHDMRAEIARLTAENKAVLAERDTVIAEAAVLIRSVSWIGEPLRCPWCENLDTQGHKTNCALVAWLVAHGEQRGIAARLAAQPAYQSDAP